MNISPISLFITKTTLLIGILLFTLSVNAQKTFTPTSGNWNIATNWNPSGVPSSSDDVTIPSGKTVNMTADAVAKSISILGSTSTSYGTLTLSNGTTLTVYGNININSYATFNGGSGNNESTTILIYGNFTNNGTANFWKSTVVIGGDLYTASSNLQTNGDIIVGGNASGTITGSGNGSIYPVNPNSTVSITGTTGTKQAGTAPTDNTLIGLMNEVIYGGTCSFTINNIANVSACSGSNTSFSVTTINTTSPTYQWQINKNDGNGWNDLTNATPYSSVTTNNLKIANVTNEMNNYQYRVKITASSCTKNGNPGVLKVNTTPDAPTVGSITQPTCSVSTGSFTIINYNNSYIYSYSNTLSRSGNTFSGPAGSHTIKATLAYASDSCSSIESTAIINTQPTTPTSPISATTQPNCTLATGTITVTPQNSGETYSYDNGVNFQTSNSKSGLVAGNYKVIIKSSGGCNSSSTALTINHQPSTPTKPTITTTQPTCAAPTGSISITSPVSNEISYSINGIDYTNTNGNFTSLNTGTYYVTAKNAAGCTSTSTSVTFSTPIVNTWTGAKNNNKWFDKDNWSTGEVPTKDDCVTINNTNKLLIEKNDQNTSATAYSITVTSGTSLEIASQASMTVTDKITVESGGTFLLQDGASLIQINNVANSGNITAIRKSTPVISSDYTYWSSPTTGSQTLYSFSPDSNPKYFLTYNNKWTTINAKTTPFEKGIGYAVISPKSTNTTPTTLTYKFIGVPTNGTFTIPVVKSGSDSTRLIGNPYPSALNADKFIAANQSKIGTLYFWTHNHAINKDGSYSPTDYASYNLTGSVSTAIPSGTGTGIGGNDKAPTKWIATGQGFIAEIIASGDITFDNTMRVGAIGTNNTNFYRSSSVENSEHELEKNRIWLDLSSNSTKLSQTLVGYIETASNEFDSGFDGANIGSNKIALYTLLKDKEYTIQGRALPFNSNEIVLLGFKTDVAGDFNISLSQFDGLFNSNQNVYIEDKLLNIVSNLKTSSYSFSTTAGTFNDRFIIKYKDDSMLGIDTFEGNQNNISITSENHIINVKCENENIQKVFVYDTLGRQIFENSNVNNYDFTISNLSSNQVYIVKAILVNGQSYTKKVIN